MSLVPIKEKQSLEKWIKTRGKYVDYSLEELIENMVEEIYEWIKYQNEINIIVIKEKMKEDIIKILYENKYILVSDDKYYEYYSLKYNEDIYELCKKYFDMISIDIGINTLKYNYMLIFDYIYDNTLLIEEEEESEEEEIYLSDAYLYHQHLL